MSILLLLTLTLAATTGDTVHVPHDSSYAIASAQLADGTVVTAIVHSEQQILVTRDDGYSWQTIRGDGIHGAADKDSSVGKQAHLKRSAPSQASEKRCSLGRGSLKRRSLCFGQW